MFKREHLCYGIIESLSIILPFIGSLRFPDVFLFGTWLPLMSNLKVRAPFEPEDMSMKNYITGNMTGRGKWKTGFFRNHLLPPLTLYLKESYPNKMTLCHNCHFAMLKKGLICFSTR